MRECEFTPPQTVLMASIQASLIPVLSEARKGNPNSRSWQAAVWFNYAGIYVDVGATLSAVYVIQWAAELTTEARTLVMENPHSMPAQVLQGKLLPQKYLMGKSEMQMLHRFGMPSQWKYLAHHMVWGFLVGAIFLFLTLTLFIFNIEGTVIGATLCLALLYGLFPVVYYLRERFMAVGVMAQFRRVPNGGS